MRVSVPVLVAGWIACSFLYAVDGRAQTVRVRVLDAEGREPIAGADLAVLGVDSAVLARAVSDSAGVVRARLPRAGEIVLHVERLGYQAWRSAAVPVGEGEAVDLEVRLGRDAIPLEPLVVVTRARGSPRLAGFRERLLDGRFGSFVTREEIERRPDASLSDLVLPLPGVSVVEVPRESNRQMYGRVLAMRGLRGGEIPGMADEANWCLPGVFLDGARIQQTPEFPLDDFITASNLEGIEVYSSAAMVPVQYQQGGSVACGAILLWTREGQRGEGRTGWWRWAVGLSAFAGIVYFMR